MAAVSQADSLPRGLALYPGSSYVGMAAGCHTRKDSTVDYLTQENAGLKENVRDKKAYKSR